MPLLEIERKFSWTTKNLKIFKANGGNPPFKRIAPVSSRVFRDVYYDSHRKLSTKGLWVRQRVYFDFSGSKNATGNQIWEAKQAVNGISFNRSTFKETRDVDLISRMVNEHVPSSSGADECFGLNQLCQFQTSRDTFLADNKFTIVLDSTDFGHSIGEVELLAEDAGKAHTDIDAFLDRYAWFFDISRPRGKLTAYFETFGTSQ